MHYFLRFSLVTTSLTVAAVLISPAIAQAPVVQPVHFFQSRVNGVVPNAGLFLAQDGNYYGTTQFGGASNAGTIYKLDSKGVVTTIYSFSTQDGSQPTGTLVEDNKGNLYGTTLYGGSKGSGTVFRYELNGNFKSLFSFNRNNNTGELPNALARGNDGNFYGTTTQGSVFGTIFKITPSGNLNVLYNFKSSRNDGRAPRGKLIQAKDGNFYGVTADGGAYGNGTVYKVTLNGSVTILYSFSAYAPNNSLGYPDYRNGYSPQSLTLGQDGDLYGVTGRGGLGTYPDGIIFRLNPVNSKFEILHKFDGKNGALPFSALLQASDGNFYGTTRFYGAPQNGGTLFKITPQGSFSLMHSFRVQPDQPHEPSSELIQTWDGNLYGTALGGGGTIYRVGLNLKPSSSDAISVVVKQSAPSILANHPNCKNSQTGFTLWQSGGAIAGFRAVGNNKLGGLLIKCNNGAHTYSNPSNQLKYEINPTDIKYFAGTYINSSKQGFSSEAIEVCHFNSFINANARCFTKTANKNVYVYTPASNPDPELKSNSNLLQVTLVQLLPQNQQPPNICFNTPDDAAVAALRSIAGKSYQEDREYGGYIRRCLLNPLKYTFTAPQLGTRTEIGLSPTLDDFYTASYHTHNYGELFSPQDKNVGARERPTYLRGPSGNIYKYTSGDASEVLIRNPFK